MHATAADLTGARLHALFSPKSVALVGASTRPHTVGNDLLRNLLFHEYSGTVYPVNTKAVSVLGVPAWPSLTALPQSVDLAVVVVPAPAVLDVADEAIATGVKAMVVLSAGFKEIGGEGAELERRLRDKVRAAGIPLIGPNCLGLMNTDPALYASQPMPRGNRLAIITNAGGPGIMATDAAIRFGLTLAPISDETKAQIRGALPPSASVRNPVDVIGDARAERYRAVLRTVLADSSVDMGMVILTPQSMTDIEDIARVVPEAIRGLEKPVVCSFMGARDVAGGVEILRRNGVPNYPFPEDAVRALAAADRLVTLHEVPDRETPEFADVDRAAASAAIAAYLGTETQRYLTQAECRPIFEAYRLPLLRNVLAHTEDAAAGAAEAIGRPVAMKVMSADVVHKYDAGGVILNIQGGADARSAWRRIHDNIRRGYPSAHIQGILVEEMARKGVEVIVGATRDPGCGPLVMFGLGGIFVEVMKDVSFRLAPMWRISARKMIGEIRAHKILMGVRGNPASDVAAIEDILLRVSTLLCHHPEISELDINPLIVHPAGEGASVADSRIMLRRP